MLDNVVDLSRLQFAATAMYHFLFVPLTLGMVWLLVIPLFNIVWNFFVYRAISESYESYFASQGRSEFGDCGKTIGLVYSICCCLCIIPFLNLLAGPAALILWIIYVIKLIGLKNQIPA